jgi:hypothetical protein
MNARNRRGARAHSTANLLALCELRGTEPRLRGSMRIPAARVDGVSDIDQLLLEDDLRFLMAE